MTKKVSIISIALAFITGALYIMKVINIDALNIIFGTILLVTILNVTGVLGKIFNKK